MAKRLGDLQGSAVDPEETEEERKARTVKLMNDAQESGTDYDVRLHKSPGTTFIGRDGYVYVVQADGSNKKTGKFAGGAKNGRK